MGDAPKGPNELSGNSVQKAVEALIAALEDVNRQLAELETQIRTALGPEPQSREDRSRPDRGS